LKSATGSGSGSHLASRIPKAKLSAANLSYANLSFANQGEKRECDFDSWIPGNSRLVFHAAFLIDPMGEETVK
jgi:hypothetical protein